MAGYKGKPEHEKVLNKEGDADEEMDIDDKTPGFKKGGKPKREMRKDGGKAEGEKPMHRPDRRPRGGHHEEHKPEHKPEHERHHRAAGGRTPYSSGSVGHGEDKSSAGRGHEDVRPPAEPD